MKEIEEVWGNQKFNVMKYMKGTSDRGFILGAVEEPLQILDDHAMQLQGMSASRFVGPFLNSVQNWEKALSLISEVLEVEKCSNRSCSLRQTTSRESTTQVHVPIQKDSVSTEKKNRGLWEPVFRFGCWCKGSGCTWKVFSLEVTSGLNCRKKRSDLTKLTKCSRR